MSVVLGTLLFAFVLAFIALLAARPGSVSKVVEYADVTWALEETELGNRIIDGLNDSELIDGIIDIDTISEFLKRENVSAQVGKVAERYAMAIADGDYDYYLNPNEIVNFVKAVAPDILEEFGASLSDDDYEFIVDSVNERVDLGVYSIGKIIGDTSMDAAVPYMLLSIYPLVIIGLIGALIVFDIFLLHRKKVRAAFLSAGIPFALSGSVCSAAGLLFGPRSGLLDGSSPYGAMSFIVGVADMLLLPALVCLAISALMILVHIIARSKQPQYVPKVSDRPSRHVWRITGLVANASALLVCFALALLFYQNIPL